MPFELPIFQNNRPLAAMMMMLLEQCGFQQQHDDEGFFKTYGNSNDVRHELLALAPNIQLDEHLENDSIYCFQHTEVGHIVVEIHPPVQLILCDVWIYPPLQQLLEPDVSSYGVRSDEEGASLGEDSGSNASGGSSCSNASSLLREWGHEREAEIEASREEQWIAEWTAARLEVRADALSAR